MKFIAEIDVMPLKALLDPQGKAVKMILLNNDYNDVRDVRIGKHITLKIEAETKEKAAKHIDEICAKILHNPIMEEYKYTININQ